MHIHLGISTCHFHNDLGEKIGSVKANAIFGYSCINTFQIYSNNLHLSSSMDIINLNLTLLMPKSPIFDKNLHYAQAYLWSSFYIFSPLIILAQKKVDKQGKSTSSQTGHRHRS